MLIIYNTERQKRSYQVRIRGFAYGHPTLKTPDLGS